MINNFKTTNSHELSLLLERKNEFQKLCVSYLNSFGWTITSESLGLIYAHDSLGQKFTIIVTYHPQEEYPTHKELKQYNGNIIFMGPEFSPISRIKGSKLKKVTRHTASGINFTYLKSNGK